MGNNNNNNNNPKLMAKITTPNNLKHTAKAIIVNLLNLMAKDMVMALLNLTANQDTLLPTIPMPLLIPTKTPMALPPILLTHLILMAKVVILLTMAAIN